MIFELPLAHRLTCPFELVGIALIDLDTYKTLTTGTAEIIWITAGLEFHARLPTRVATELQLLIAMR